MDNRNELTERVKTLMEKTGYPSLQAKALSVATSPQMTVVTLDTWYGAWTLLGEAASVVNQLSTIFEQARLEFRVKNQPTGPSRKRSDENPDDYVFTIWDNRPLLEVFIKHSTANDDPAPEDKQIALLESAMVSVRQGKVPVKIFAARPD